MQDKKKVEISGRRVSKSGQKQKPSTEPLTISGRWLSFAVIGTVTAAALCAWGVLCLLFWQGSWQLLYHPSASVARTPASAGLAFDPVAFAVTDEGQPQLAGWWIPSPATAPSSSYTVLFLHRQTGDIGDTVDALGRLHSTGVNVLAFDYRGYGHSQFARPSEAHWRQDAEWALKYLSETRHIPPKTIVLYGQDLGANLALELAVVHPELAGVILESPDPSPLDVIFSDARARLVPARLLVHDRYDLNAAAGRLRVPILWFEWNAPDGTTGVNQQPAAYGKIADQKTLVWLNPQVNANRDFSRAVILWLDHLPVV
jgi:uncharacterized protein